MATEEEKKIARAYNVGFTLSMYDPKLLEQIIKRNPKNDFVKIMEVAKNHHEVQVNIPKKELSREYKNGYFNAQSLSANNPELLDKMINTNTSNKDFARGLKDGKKEYQVRQTMKRIQHEREGKQRDLNRDYGMEN